MPESGQDENMIDKQKIADKMKNDMEANATEYDEPVKISVIPFWVAQEGETIEGFVSDAKYTLPGNFRRDSTYAVTLYRPTTITMTVTRGEPGKLVECAPGDEIVLSTHNDLMQKMQDGDIREGDSIKITCIEASDADFVNADGKTVTVLKRTYEVRKAKKKPVGKSRSGFNSLG